MTDFYVTFGQQYAREPHPAWAGIHPDGWITIEALDYEAARSRTIKLFGTQWCWLYDPTLTSFRLSFFPRDFPRGELLRVASDDSLPISDKEV